MALFFGFGSRSDSATGVAVDAPELFADSDVRYSYLRSDQHHRFLAAAICDELSKGRSLILLTGEPQAGGDLIARTINNEIQESYRATVAECRPDMDFSELVRIYCYQLGITAKTGQGPINSSRGGVATKILVQSRLVGLTAEPTNVGIWALLSFLTAERRNGITRMLILNNAEELDPRCFDDLQRFAQLDDQHIMPMVLASGIAKPQMMAPFDVLRAPFAGRIAVDHLESAEVTAFIKYQLDAAGENEEFDAKFPPQIIDAIAVASGGNPAVVNRLARKVYIAWSTRPRGEMPITVAPTGTRKPDRHGEEKIETVWVVGSATGNKGEAVNGIDPDDVLVRPTASNSTTSSRDIPNNETVEADERVEWGDSAANVIFPDVCDTERLLIEKTSAATNSPAGDWSIRDVAFDHAAMRTPRDASTGAIEIADTSELSTESMVPEAAVVSEPEAEEAELRRLARTATVEVVENDERIHEIEHANLTDLRVSPNSISETSPPYTADETDEGVLEAAAPEHIAAIITPNEPILLTDRLIVVSAAPVAEGLANRTELHTSESEAQPAIVETIATETFSATIQDATVERAAMGTPPGAPTAAIEITGTAEPSTEPVTSEATAVSETVTAELAVTALARAAAVEGVPTEERANELTIPEIHAVPERASTGKRPGEPIRLTDRLVPTVTNSGSLHLEADEQANKRIPATEATLAGASAETPIIDLVATAAPTDNTGRKADEQAADTAEQWNELVVSENGAAADGVVIETWSEAVAAAVVGEDGEQVTEVTAETAARERFAPGLEVRAAVVGGGRLPMARALGATDGPGRERSTRDASIEHAVTGSLTAAVEDTENEERATEFAIPEVRAVPERTSAGRPLGEPIPLTDRFLPTEPIGVPFHDEPNEQADKRNPEEVATLARASTGSPVSDPVGTAAVTDTDRNSHEQTADTTAIVESTNSATIAGGIAPIVSSVAAAEPPGRDNDRGEEGLGIPYAAEPDAVTNEKRARELYDNGLPRFLRELTDIAPPHEPKWFTRRIGTTITIICALAACVLVMVVAIIPAGHAPREASPAVAESNSSPKSVGEPQNAMSKTTSARQTPRAMTDQMQAVTAERHGSTTSAVTTKSTMPSNDSSNGVAPRTSTQELGRNVLPPVPQKPSQTDVVPSEEIALMVQRGGQLLSSGDIISAREFFQRVASTGNAAAAYGLAETYDPVFLHEIGARGVTGDARTATAWYQRAIAAGSVDAIVRLARLRSTLVSGSIPEKGVGK